MPKSLTFNGGTTLYPSLCSSQGGSQEKLFVHRAVGARCASIQHPSHNHNNFVNNFVREVAQPETVSLSQTKRCFLKPLLPSPPGCTHTETEKQMHLSDACVFIVQIPYTLFNLFHLNRLFSHCPTCCLQRGSTSGTFTPGTYY